MPKGPRRHLLWRKPAIGFEKRSNGAERNKWAVSRVHSSYSQCASRADLRRVHYRKIRQVRADGDRKDADFDLPPEQLEGRMATEKKAGRLTRSNGLVRWSRRYRALELGWDLKQLATKPQTEGNCNASWPSWPTNLVRS